MRPGFTGALNAVHTRGVPTDIGVVATAVGSVIGMVGENTWAALPQIGGEAGYRYRWISGHLSAGFELFGFARRGEWTVFSGLGAYGGAGVSLHIHPDWAIVISGNATWLPNFTNARMVEPTDKSAQMPHFLFGYALLSVQWHFPQPRSAERMFDDETDFGDL